MLARHIQRQCKHSLFTDDVPYIWTSGRLCDFKGCESRKDLEPKNILGWFWSANREKIQATNQASIQTMRYTHNFTAWN